MEEREEEREEQPEEQHEEQREEEEREEQREEGRRLQTGRVDAARRPPARRALGASAAHRDERTMRPQTQTKQQTDSRTRHRRLCLSVSLRSEATHSLHSVLV